jgi:hypothetical protein
MRLTADEDIASSIEEYSKAAAEIVEVAVLPGTAIETEMPDGAATARTTAASDYQTAASSTVDSDYQTDFQTEMSEGSHLPEGTTLDDYPETFIPALLTTMMTITL